MAMIRRSRIQMRSNFPVLKFVSFLMLFAWLSKSLMAQPCKEVIGYYPNWQWYDRSKLVNPQSIDYSKYTILNYAFFNPKATGKIDLTDPWADENLLLGQKNWSTGGYYPNTSLIDLAHNNGVKILAAIGGWTLSDNFPTIAADPAKRDTFAQACIDLIQQYNFDGIDIDWEYPGFATHSGTPQDKVNYTLLLQAIRSALDVHGLAQNKTYLLTTCVSANAVRMVDVEWNLVSPIVDAINIMSYDFFGAWDGLNNHNSPLYAPAQGDTTFNLNAAVNKLIHHYGVNPQKLNAGLAFYGRSQTTASSPSLHGASTGQGDNATFGVDQGTPLYYNVLSNLNLFTEHWDATAKVPYLLGNGGLNTFVSYDNEQSIGLKAEYIVDKNMRGAIVWEITGDYIETSPGSGVIAGTPLADTLNKVFCNYSPVLSTNKLSSEADFAVQAFPNPTQKETTLHFDQTYDKIRVEIRDVLGRLVSQSTWQQEQAVQVELGATKGIYFVRISIPELGEQTLSILKE